MAQLFNNHPYTSSSKLWRRASVPFLIRMKIVVHYLSQPRTVTIYLVIVWAVACSIKMVSIYSIVASSPGQNFSPSLRNVTERRRREKFGPGIYYRDISAHAHSIPSKGEIRKHFVSCCICSSNLSFSKYCCKSSLGLVQRSGQVYMVTCVNPSRVGGSLPVNSTSFDQQL